MDTEIMFQTLKKATNIWRFTLVTVTCAYNYNMGVARGVWVCERRYMCIQLQHGRCQGCLGMRTTPLLGKIFEIDCENPLHKKIFEIDHENPGFLRKLPPFQSPGDAPVQTIPCTLNNLMSSYIHVNLEQERSDRVLELFLFFLTKKHILSPLHHLQCVFGILNA
jgi:hypothetical protein